MSDDRRRELGNWLSATADCWHPQPFCEPRPAWCAAQPALAHALLALDDEAAETLNGDAGMAQTWLAPWLPVLGEGARLTASPNLEAAVLQVPPGRWNWEIPGRKQAQITRFAQVARQSGAPLVDWCGGKGHLGRLLGLAWNVPVTTLELQESLCSAGGALAARAGVGQRFVAADALSPGAPLPANSHAVALHACGELHRTLLRRAVLAGLPGIDVAPCCYHLGAGEQYRPLASGTAPLLTQDDLRLAVTETVTAGRRARLARDRGMAWKLGFAAWRATVDGKIYRKFRPVPPTVLRLDFAGFMAWMTAREQLPMPGAGDLAGAEQSGWQRQREVIRLSVVRHAFRRAIEVWLALDLAVFLQAAGYQTRLGCFCEREVTPRNLLLSAWR